MKRATGTTRRKDPEGGLTAEGRKYFAQRQGSHLKPGVRGAADTPEKMRRKGSFLSRMFTTLRGPLVKDGKPTRLALSAHAWGEPVPKTTAAAKKLSEKGHRLLEQYGKLKAEKEGKMATAKKGTKSSRGRASAASRRPRTASKPTRSSDAVGASTKSATPRKKVARARRTKASTSGSSSGEKNSLVSNINRRRTAGTSRPKSKSTVSEKSYRRLQEGWS